MQNEAQKITLAVKDRRLLGSPTAAFGDYWRTYATAVVWALLYFYVFEGQKAGVFLLFVGMLTIALSAARDATKGMERKFDAIVRRLEDKSII